MKIQYVLYAAVAALLCLALGGFVHHTNDSARITHDSLVVAIDAADRANVAAAALAAAADSATARAARTEAAADSLGRLERRAVVRYVAVRDSAPAECAPVIDAANAALALADQKADSLRSSLAETRGALTDTRTALDSVRASESRLRAAAVAVDRGSRPGLLERLTPRVGIGAAAGLDPLTRRPATVVGVTFGWRIL